MNKIEQERERLLDFFSARYYDCETEQQRFTVRKQLLESLARFNRGGIITDKLIKEVDDLLSK